eukprot:13180187-Alexandrium_andersonii.AAC.1
MPSLQPVHRPMLDWLIRRARVRACAWATSRSPWSCRFHHFHGQSVAQRGRVKQQAAAAIAIAAGRGRRPRGQHG